MVMSRAIRSTSLNQPALFIHSMNDDFAAMFREFIDQYNTVNQIGLSTPKKLNPDSDIEFSVNELYRLSQSLCMSEGGRNWTECNSIIDSMQLLDKASNELTLYNYIEPITSKPFVDFNDYTVKLFENVSRMDRLDQQQTYDYDKQAYRDSPAYNLGLEWQEKFHELLMDIGFPQEIYSRMTVSRYWRVDSLLSATASMVENKFNFITYFGDTMPSGMGYSRSVGMQSMNFDKRFITEPLETISKVVKGRQRSAYDDFATSVANALRDVAFANELIKLNPQIKTMGLTEISSYNHQSYYFKEERKFMTKQNTEFLDVALLPAFTTKEYALLSYQNLNYATMFMDDATDKLEDAVAEAKKVQGAKLTEGIEAMSNHWFAVVKHFYKQQRIDEIGLLYSNLMFPNMNPQNRDIYEQVMNNIQPLQDTKAVHTIDLGDEYSVTMTIYQQQIGFQFYDKKYRNTILNVDGDFYEGVKEVIMDKGVPQYLQQPLNQILVNATADVNQNSNFELQNVSSRIYHIENQRRTKLEALQERRLELARQKFV